MAKPVSVMKKPTKHVVKTKAMKNVPVKSAKTKDRSSSKKNSDVCSNHSSQASTLVFGEIPARPLKIKNNKTGTKATRPKGRQLLIKLKKTKKSNCDAKGKPIVKVKPVAKVAKANSKSLTPGLPVDLEKFAQELT